MASAVSGNCLGGQGLLSAGAALHVGEGVAEAGEVGEVAAWAFAHCAPVLSGQGVLVPGEDEQQGVAVNTTMNGRHIAPWAVYTDDGTVDTVFPPTYQTFAMTQSHWFRIDDDRIIEHWANRDDIGMAKQLGWIPPSPIYLVKMARAKRRARRS